MFGIGAAEIIIVGFIAACPLVVLFLVIYFVRRAGNLGQASSEEKLLLQELAERVDRMDERLSALETVLPERHANE